MVGLRLASLPPQPQWPPSCLPTLAMALWHPSISQAGKKLATLVIHLPIQQCVYVRVCCMYALCTSVVCRCMFSCMDMWRPEWEIRIYYSQIYCLDSSLSLMEPVFAIWLDGLASKLLGSAHLYSPIRASRLTQPCLTFDTSTGEPNSGLHVRRVSVLIHGAISPAQFNNSIFLWNFLLVRMVAVCSSVQ